MNPDIIPPVDFSQETVDFETPTSEDQLPKNIIPTPNGSNQFLVMIVSLVIFIFLISLARIGYCLLSRNNQAINHRATTDLHPELKPTPVDFQTISLFNTDLKDSATSLYFSDANKIYKLQLDGSQAQEIASFPANISELTMLSDGSLIIYIDNSKYEKVVNKQSGNSEYKQVTIDRHHWILRKDTNTPIELTDQEYESLQATNSHPSGEKIYTKILPSGQAEILSDKFDGNPPTRIGLLKKKPLKVQTCEIGNNCFTMEYPQEFYSSFNGSYLLNRPPGGGGLGVPGIVVSRDGSKFYNIDFYWYVSSAAWISDNRLLAKNQDGNQKIITFKEDGTFSEDPLKNDLKGDFDEKTLSPSRGLLFITDQTKNVSLYDLKQDRIIPVESFNEDQARTELNIAPNEIVVQGYSFLGWNKNSDKVLFSSSTGAISGAHDNDRTIKREIRVYDGTTAKVYTLAKLNPDPINPDDTLLNKKPFAYFSHFVIK